MLIQIWWMKEFQHFAYVFSSLSRSLDRASPDKSSKTIRVHVCMRLLFFYFVQNWFLFSSFSSNDTHLQMQHVNMSTRQHVNTNTHHLGEIAVKLLKIIHVFFLGSVFDNSITNWQTQIYLIFLFLFRICNCPQICLLLFPQIKFKRYHSPRSSI